MATVLIDLKSHIFDINPQFTELFGYTIGKIKGKDINKLLLSEDITDEGRKFDKATSENGYINVEGVRVKKNDSKVNVLISANPFVFKGKRVGIIVTYSDITVLKKSTEEISFLAAHDALTGLCNRQVLPEMFYFIASQSDRTGHKAGVFFSDIYEFKDINDVYGHGAGDVMLKEAANRLSKIIRHSDIVVRWGGDEFVIVTDNIKNIEDIVSMAIKIISTMREPFKIGGTSIVIGLNIGISIYPDDGTDLDELLRKADIAMYNAKARGENNFELYSKQIEDARIKIISDFKMRETQFRLVFEESPLALCLLDSNEVIYRANNNFKKIFNLEMQDILGRHFIELIPKDKREEFKKALEEAKKNGEGVVNTTLQVKNKVCFYEVHVNSIPVFKNGDNFYAASFVDVTYMQNAIKEVEELYENFAHATIRLVEARDPHTAGHGKRVSKIAAAIAKKLGLYSDTIHRIEIAGLLHDIGKIATPDDILNKPGKLEKEEFEILKKHSQRGYEILKEIEYFDDIAEMVLNHHERFNGSGYPNGISGDKIPIGAREYWQLLMFTMQ